MAQFKIRCRSFFFQYGVERLESRANRIRDIVFKDVNEFLSVISIFICWCGWNSISLLSTWCHWIVVGSVKTGVAAPIFYMRAWMKVRFFLLVCIKFGTGDLNRYLWSDSNKP